MIKSSLIFLMMVLAFNLGLKNTCWSQDNIFIHAEALDGNEITPENILSFQVQSNLNYAVNAEVGGLIRYRDCEHNLSFKCTIKLNPGINNIDKSIQVSWTYSSTGVRELFTEYRLLPAGMYEYCITVKPEAKQGEIESGRSTTECIYNKNQELFLINLVDPDDNAKIYDYHPTLTWIANYPFANELTYKLRVVEMKRGQTTVGAIQRNNPIYVESALRQNSIIYPVTAKPLQCDQPYAWTVDAYYKGVLLGSAEAWKFTILEDKNEEVPAKDMSYIEVNLENGTHTALLVGKIKMKYIERELRNNRLTLEFCDETGKLLHQIKSPWEISQGESRKEIDLESLHLFKHKKVYMLKISNKQQQYQIRFKYYNPDFVQ